MKINRLFVGITLVPMLVSCNPVKENIGSIFNQNKTNTTATTGDVIPVSRNDSNEIKGKRYALVIGNANYIGDPNIRSLKNPVNDARDMKKTLETVGFNVIYRENVADQEAMEAAVDEFYQQLKRAKGIGLFYYAGHGIQANGENYLIPTKARIPTQVQLKHRAMPASYVLDNMEYAKNALNIIVLDACRNNPLPARGRSVAKSGLAKMNTPSGSILIYSTSPGKQAYDGDGRNGIFTKYLLKGIKKYGQLTIGDMLMNVRRNVQQATSNKPVSQVPWENTSLLRQFCFSPSGCKNPQAEAAERRAREAERRLIKAERRVREAERRAKKTATIPTNNDMERRRKFEAAKQAQRLKEAERRVREAELRAQKAEERQASQRSDDFIITAPIAF